ncbi:cid1 family poly A polymerase domain-containing protein [Hirsutella rhossiliensis]|uniref:polynucleotide adenylyltransferase n=1 Tax=Hirsutella rhossiliensis TaxID=111463 RepID=A0A9P8MT26_9HYPO|nr:cid1 family poly A polymerase domain-containing protein [Hirsutella rhossiliensis]KAH0961478.1 cid1 family poly A polymerase domain-containing protein [Hirsutella rhossiliensis]
MSRSDSWRADGRDRGSYDSWRPSSDRRDRDDRRQGYDSHRGSGQDSHRGSGYDSHRGSGYGRPGDAYRAPPADVYRPQLPQSDFTFRVDQPLHVAPFTFPPATHPPSGRRGERRGGPPRKPGRPRWQPPPHPSERALISGDTFRLPGQRIFDTMASAKFRNVDEMSDDEEIAMEMSSQSSQSGIENPAPKRARTQAKVDDAADTVPKWSNPDPYTALPCPDEGTRKKKDMVKLIRKARVEDVQPNTDAPPEAENFISFDSSDEEDNRPPPPISLPPRPPPLPRTDHPDAGKNTSSAVTDTKSTRDASGPLGSRKRTFDDEIKPPDYGQLKKGSLRPSKGALVPEWQPKDGEEACPWRAVGSSAADTMTVRLHKEILGFYEFVRPREFEQRIRTNLVEHLKRAMQRDGRNFASAHVYPFGSFMSGLYLPTADMDLVVCSASFIKGGPPTYLAAKSWLYKFQKLLVSQGVADVASVTVIAHARIPLVKFVDKLTGLKVDVSFENMGGVKAVDTFLQWKLEYPTMPILVTIVKHFLLMRGLNEPVNGGIGGFSVICLVVSMLQTMPQLQGRGVTDEEHLGLLLLDFFELYGCHFRHKTNAISLKGTVGYVRKSAVSTFTYRNTNRLSIIDPNNPGNDIAGGSSNTEAILDRFYDAFHDLRDRMKYIKRHPDRGGILDVILKGNYSSFRLQRKYLKHVHQETIGPCSDQD